MSFKDLTARAAAAKKLKPSEKAKPPAKENISAEEHESKADAKDPGSDSRKP